jgi:hypothetical protein
LPAAKEGFVNSWLTTHYPHPNPDNHPWHIYLQRKHKEAVKEVAVGDRVFFYEYKRQKPIKGAAKYPTGLQGIVRVARVSGGTYQRETVIEYADGTTGYWSWGIPTESADTSGFVKLRDVLKVIAYKPGSVLFGFNGGTGVMKLNDEQDTALMELFKRTSRPRA